MSKKPLFIGLISILAFSILFFPAVVDADQFYAQYSGNCFQPRKNTATYIKGADGWLSHNDTDDERYFCPVNFNVPDGSAYFIKSIGMRFLDNLDDGNLYVILWRQNLYTGNYHIVAYWEGSLVGQNSSVQTASQGTTAGYKLVDTKKFSYWLEVLFFRNGTANPYPDLALFQIRVHYGT